MRGRRVGNTGVSAPLMGCVAIRVVGGGDRVGRAAPAQQSKGKKSSDLHARADGHGQRDSNECASRGGARGPARMRRTGDTGVRKRQAACSIFELRAYVP